MMIDDELLWLQIVTCTEMTVTMTLNGSWSLNSDDDIDEHRDHDHDDDGDDDRDDDRDDDNDEDDNNDDDEERKMRIPQLPSL